MENKKSGVLSSFSFTYWIVIVFEFFERGAYYGVMSILSIYMTDILGFSKPSVGVIKSTIQPLLYILPILSGAVADRMGYRKTLMVAFTFLGLGYILASQTTDYAAVFIALVIMGFGAGTFKPIISGTIARETNPQNSTMGFGIFYWSINLGAFIFPLVIVPYLKTFDWSYILLMAGIVTGLMLLPTIFLFKEPVKEKHAEEPLSKTLKGIIEKIFVVFMDWRFILFILIYSMFWILYFQMFDTVLWYVKDFVDATPLNNFVNSIFGINWKFDVEHVTVMNALTIIVLQLGVSYLVKNTKALPTLVAGISLGTLGMAILAFSSNIWVFLAGITIFSIGEMTAHPKYISYLGEIAPQDKKATYLGFGFLYGFFGSLIGGYLGAWLYVKLIDNPMIAFVKSKLAEMGQSALISEKVTISEAVEIAKSVGISKEEIALHAYPSELWLLFTGIGLACIIGLLLYEKFIGTRTKAH